MFCHKHPMIELDGFSSTRLNESMDEPEFCIPGKTAADATKKRTLQLDHQHLTP